MFCILWQKKKTKKKTKTKKEQLKTAVSLENTVENISGEDRTEMTSPFRLDIITQYIFPYKLLLYPLTKDCHKA